MISETDRFNISHPNLCAALRWKGQFIATEPDRTVPSMSDHFYWCIHTQTCIGPDGKIAEPGNCSSSRRTCHGTGKCG
jgi:hypothetical protein